MTTEDPQETTHDLILFIAEQSLHVNGTVFPFIKMVDTNSLLPTLVIFLFFVSLTLSVMTGLLALFSIKISVLEMSAMSSKQYALVRRSNLGLVQPRFHYTSNIMLLYSGVSFLLATLFWIPDFRKANSSWYYFAIFFLASCGIFTWPQREQKIPSSSCSCVLINNLLLKLDHLPTIALLDLFEVLKSQHCEHAVLLMVLHAILRQPLDSIFDKQSPVQRYSWEQTFETLLSPYVNNLQELDEERESALESIAVYAAILSISKCSCAAIEFAKFIDLQPWHCKNNTIKAAYWLVRLPSQAVKPHSTKSTQPQVSPHLLPPPILDIHSTNSTQSQVSLHPLPHSIPDMVLKYARGGSASFLYSLIFKLSNVEPPMSNEYILRIVSELFRVDDLPGQPIVDVGILPVLLAIVASRLFQLDADIKRGVDLKEFVDLVKFNVNNSSRKEMLLAIYSYVCVGLAIGKISQDSMRGFEDLSQMPKLSLNNVTLTVKVCNSIITGRLGLLDISTVDMEQANWSSMLLRMAVYTWAQQNLQVAKLLEEGALEQGSPSRGRILLLRKFSSIRPLFSKEYAGVDLSTGPWPHLDTQAYTQSISVQPFLQFVFHDFSNDPRLDIYLDLLISIFREKGLVNLTIAMFDMSTTHTSSWELLRSRVEMKMAQKDIAESFLFQCELAWRVDHIDPTNLLPGFQGLVWCDDAEVLERTLLMLLEMMRHMGIECLEQYDDLTIKLFNKLRTLSVQVPHDMEEKYKNALKNALGWDKPGKMIISDWLVDLGSRPHVRFASWYLRSRWIGYLRKVLAKVNISGP